MTFKRLFFSLILITVTSPVFSATNYLHYPSGNGNTAWSASSGPNTVDTSSSSSTAAIFSKNVATYSLNSNVYFDVSGLSASTVNIDSLTSDIIDLSGRTFTVNGPSGKTVNFVAALHNSQISTSGGLSIVGGAAVTFDSTGGQYSAGMDIGALSVSGSTVTLPAGANFGEEGNGGSSYSPITLQNAILLLGSGAQIGSNGNNISVPITLNDSNSTIQLSSGGAACSITPYFSAISQQTLNINTNGGTLNIYGNDSNRTTGSGITLNINDTTGTGTVNLYGWQTQTAGGNDYAGTNLAVASGNVNLQLDTGDQSFSDILMTGGVLTGMCYGGNVTLSGNSFFSGTGIVSSVTMSGISVISPPPTSQGTYSINSANDIIATSDTPHYYVNLNSTSQYSQIQADGNASIPNLCVNLLLAAGTYTRSTATQSCTIINGGGELTAPTANPTWSPENVFLNSAHTEPATGTELQLSLAEDSGNLILEVDILQDLYVSATQTAAGGIQDPIGSVTTSSIQLQVEAILGSVQGLPVSQAVAIGNALFASAERASILGNLGAAGSAMVASSAAQSASSTQNINTYTIHNIASVVLDYQNDISIPIGSSHLFTVSGRQLFIQLGQQLPFLQFQSVHSLVDQPITAPTSIPVATSFEQPKHTLKPVYLSNGISHIWMQPFAGIQRHDSYDHVTGMTLRNGGTAFGVGHKISPNVTLGVLMGGALNSYTLNQNNGSGAINNYYMGLYGGYAPSEGFNLKGSALIGQDYYTSQRNITALSLSAKNSHRGQHMSGNMEAGYKFNYGVSSLSPYVGLTLSKAYQNAYQETNAGSFNLSMPSSLTQNFSTEIGARFRHLVMVDEVLLQPLVGISVLREQPLQKQGNSTLRFADSSDNFVVPMSGQMKTYATATIGCAALFKNNIALSSLLTGKIKRHEQAIELVLKASYIF